MEIEIANHFYQEAITLHEDLEIPPMILSTAEAYLSKGKALFQKESLFAYYDLIPFAKGATNLITINKLNVSVKPPLGLRWKHQLDQYIDWDMCLIR